MSRTIRVTMAGPYPLDPECPSGGVEAAVQNLVLGLSKLPGVHVKVVAPTPSGYAGSALENAAVTYVQQGSGLRGWWTGLHRGLYDRVRAEPGDLIHVQGFASLARRIPGSLLTVHGLFERDTWQNSSSRRVPRTVAAYVMEGLPRALATATIEVSDRRPSPLARIRHRVWRIPNAIHPRYFQEAEILSRAPVITGFATVGTISPLKGTMGTIQAMSAVVRDVPEAQLYIAGPGADTEYGRACSLEIRRRNLTGHVHMLGALQGREVQELLQSVGTLVQFSLQENAPVAIAEALAVGCQVIGTRVGGVPRLLSGVAGCSIIEPGDTQQLARAMKYSMHDDAAGRSARRRVAQRFSPVSVAAQTLQVYESMHKTR